VFKNLKKKKTLHSVFGDTHGPNKVDSGEIPCNRKLSFLVCSLSQGHCTQNKREQFDPINIFNSVFHQWKSREVGFKPLDKAPTKVKVTVGQKTY